VGSTGRLCKEDCLETALEGIRSGGEPCIKRQIIPDCGCKIAEGSFAKFSGEPSITATVTEAFVLRLLQILDKINK